MALKDKFLLGLAKWGFSSRRADFYSDLAEALEDKAVLVDQIRLLERRARARKDTILPLYVLWLQRLDDRSFGKALMDTVPPGDVMIVEAAEESGEMVEGLRFLSKAIEASNKMKDVLIKSVAGPVFLMMMFVALLTGFSFYLVPVLAQIMKPATWPAIGQALYAVSQVVTGYGIWIGVGLIGLISIYIWSLTRWVGKWRTKCDTYIPLYSIYRDFEGSIFLVAFSSLMRSGMGISESLRALGKRASPWLKWHINRIQIRLESEADQPYKAFDTGVFNRTLTDRIIDFGSRNSVEVAFTKVGLSSIDKLTEFVASSAMVLNKLLIVLCGATMIFMVSGVLLTAQEAQNAIMRQTFIK